MITTVFGRRTLAAARPVSAGRGWNGWVASVLCLSAAAMAVAVAAWPVIASGLYPGGADQLGHLLRLWYLTKVVAEEHAIPNWLPLWYNGQDFSQYYPPLVYYLMLPLNLLLREPVLTYRVFIFMSMFLAAGLTYLAVRAYLGHL
ncbi:MAG: hypothetical protein Q8P00_06465, partial [Dehalococcoidia bacterium]|nr:hypothetical protein [Dehalococcoidia bacterium]